MKIKAAVIYEKNGPFVIKDIDLAEPQYDEVIVKIAGCGVCHTDAAAREDLFGISFPLIVGHEGSGIVEKVGAGVKGLSPGDTVLFAPYSCGKCEYCLSGHPAECEKMEYGNFKGVYGDGKKRHVDADGIEISSFFSQSAFATHAIANERNLVKVDVGNIDLALFGPLSCGIQTGAGTVFNILNINAGSTFAVFGCGGVGLAAVMAAKIAGCSRIIGIDAVDSRLEMAKELGCTDVINGKAIDDLTKELKNLSRGGLNFAFDTTGVPFLINSGINALKPMGSLAFCASMGEGTIEISLTIRNDSRKLIGVTEGDSNYPLFLPKLIEYYKQGLLPFDKFTKFYTLDDIEQAFEDTLSGKVIKPIIRMI